MLQNHWKSRKNFNHIEPTKNKDYDVNKILKANETIREKRKENRNEDIILLEI